MKNIQKKEKIKQKNRVAKCHDKNEYYLEE